MDALSTRDRILIEAEKQFVRNGIAATQMMDIAKTLTINRRTLYRYFPSKDHLAFEIELVITGKLQDYLNGLAGDIGQASGYEKVRAYFERMDVDYIREWIRFMAEFDRYFQNDYPDKALEKCFLDILNPENDALFQYIAEGITDGSIRNDRNARELYHFLSQSFIALFQRLILRQNHLKEEYCSDVDFMGIFKTLLLSGLKNKCVPPIHELTIL